MNNRGQNQNHQRKFEGMYPQNPNPYPHSAVPAPNSSGFLISGGQRAPRHFVNAAPHNVNDMKNNHMSNLTHGQMLHISPRPTLPHHIRPNAPRNIPRGPFQYQVFVPGNVAYQGNNNPYYQYNTPQVSQTVLMPYSYPNQQGSIYFAQQNRAIPIANLQQGPQNPPVANISNAQNSHGPPLIVQSQPMEMASNSQPLQVPQQPATTPIQAPELRLRRKNAAIKIIDPNTGNEIVLNNSTQQPPSADELEKMKVQSQFQSLVQSVVKKDDSKVTDNQNNEGGEKVRSEFQSRVKKLVGEVPSLPPKAIEVNEAQLPEDASNKTEEIVNVTSIEEIPIETQVVDSAIPTEEVIDVNESEDTSSNSLPSSTPTHELPSLNTDVTNISEDSNNAKKSPDEESSKPVKSKKSKSKKKKNVAKDTDETVNNVQPSIIETIEPVTNIVQENELPAVDEQNISNKDDKNKEDEEKIPENNGIEPEAVEVVVPAPKLPSYLEKLPYAEGQWSATNQTGKKVYSKQFLIQLGNEAVCQKKPSILSNWVNITRSSNSPQYGSLGGMVPNLPRSQSASATGFMPSYFKPGNSQRGVAMMQQSAKRNSSQGKTASKTAKPNTIHMSLSLREEVKLNQTDNAWVPTAAKKATKVDLTKNKNEEEIKTEDINKSVRSILNKITPENQAPLTEKFKELPIDSIERLEKTIDLVFEKAIEEQSFAPLYASLCSAMQSLQVSSGEGNKTTTSFKKLIISKCQSLFELDKAQEMDSAKKLSEINSCKDPEKKKELQLEYEENERRLRKRSVGNCRFIGELFKQKILTPNIMLYCIVILVTKHVEEPLECLCNLLKTVGKELEQSYNLNETFDKLKALTSKEMKSKIPSRIRFMIQDVIDLRRDKWIPRRNVSKPKLINEIENDAKNEAIEQSMSLSASYRPEKQQRDHHRGDDKFRGGDNKSRRGNDEWNVVQNTKYKQQNYTIDQSKLAGFKESSSVTTLGPPKWSFSNSAGAKSSSTFTSSNTFAALNDDKKSSSTSQMMSNKNTPRKPVISETEERQRMMSGVASMMPQFAQTTPAFNSVSSQISSKETVEEPVIELDPDVADLINLQCKNIIHEYEQMHNIDDVIELLTKKEKSSIRTRHVEFVKSMALITLDSKSNSRTEAGKIFAELLSQKVISMDTVTQGIDAVLKDWNDYLMDYPQFFSYIAAIIAPLLISKTAKFEINNLKDACSSICPNNSSQFFIELLQTILSSKETQNIKEQVGGILWMYNKWRKSDVPLDIFMPSDDLNKHFKNDRIGIFLLSIAMYDKMRQTDSKPSYDVMHSWISANVSDKIIKCPQFMRALTIAIIIACLKSNLSFEDIFDHVYVKLLTCYIRSEPLPEHEIQAREVQCLYGIQIMSAAHEHPGGMVLKLFNKLYQDSVISKESFELWKKEDEFKSGFDEDLETKTMAVVVLSSFFLSLVTNDSDEEDVTDA